jgi:hypothetical protein
MAGRPLRPIRHYRKSPYWNRYASVDLSGANALVFDTSTAALTALATAGVGQTDTCILNPSGFQLEMYQSTEQTAFPTGQATGGIEIALDQVNNEAVEYTFGPNTGLNPYACLLGTDPNWFVKAKLEITDVSGTDQCALFFRKVEAYQASPNFATDGVYTDFAAINVISGDVNICTDLNNSGTATVTDTGFNWANTLTHEIEIRVIARRAYYLINGVMFGNTVSYDGDGAAITAQGTITPPAFTFDSGDRIHAGIQIRQDSDLTPVILHSFSVGPLLEAGLDTELRRG